MEIGDSGFACRLFCLVHLISVTLWLCYSCKHCKYSAIKKCNLNKKVDITHEGFLLLNYTQIRVYNVDYWDTLQCAPVGVIPFGDVLPRSMASGDTF